MTIPDPMIYATAPVIGAIILWAGRKFVQDNQATKEMNIGDYGKLAEVLKRELNGRYMFASEAREQFGTINTKLAEMEQKIIHQSNGIKQFIRAEIAGSQRDGGDSAKS